MFEILELFQIKRTPLSLNEICKALGYPASSGSVLLKSMVTLGYVDYNKSARNYMPTMKLWDLGGWVQNAIFGDGTVLEIMKSLSDQFEETITLTVQSDLYAQYLYLIPSRLPIWYQVPLGTIRPLTGSASGLMILSQKSNGQIEKICRRIRFHKLDPHNQTLAQIMEKVQICRAQGYYFSKNSIMAGAGGIAALLADRSHGRSHAIGVHGPISRIEAREKAIIAALTVAAQPASDTLTNAPG